VIDRVASNRVPDVINNKRGLLFLGVTFTIEDLEYERNERSHDPA
jgi:hypothetical protein